MAIGSTVFQLNSLANTPVNIDVSKKKLQFYDLHDAQIIFNVFCNSFPLNFVGPCMPSESKISNLL